MFCSLLFLACTKSYQCCHFDKVNIATRHEPRVHEMWRFDGHFPLTTLIRTCKTMSWKPKGETWKAIWKSWKREPSLCKESGWTSPSRGGHGVTFHTQTWVSGSGAISWVSINSNNIAFNNISGFHVKTMHRAVTQKSRQYEAMCYWLPLYKPAGPPCPAKLCLINCSQGLLPPTQYS